MFSNLDVQQNQWLEHKKGRSHDKSSSDAPPPMAAKCGICASAQHGRRSSHGFSCCQTCWSFLVQSEVKMFRAKCQNQEASYTCDLEAQRAEGKRMCAGCRIRKAISIGFSDPKLANSPHAHLLDEVNSETRSSIQDDEQPQNVNITPCDECEDLYSLRVGEVDPPVGSTEHICHSCRAKRAISLGLRLPGASPSKGNSAELFDLPDLPDDDDRRVRHSRRSPHGWVKDSTNSKRFAMPGRSCALCGNVEYLSKLRQGGFVCCQNCKNFLAKSQDRATFPPECLTGRNDCQVKHISFHLMTATKRICPGCRARKAIRLGYVHRPSDKSKVKQSPGSQRKPLSAKAAAAVASKEARTTEAPISHQQHRANGSRIETTSASSAPAPKRFASEQCRCAICSKRRHLSLRPEGFCCCDSCERFLARAPRHPEYPRKCDSGRFKCELRYPAHGDRKTAIVPLCSGCRARRAISLGFEWPKPTNFVGPAREENSKQAAKQVSLAPATQASSNPAVPASETRTAASAKTAPREKLTGYQWGRACELCLINHETRTSAYGFRWCVKCRGQLKMSKHEGRRVECITGRWQCLREPLKPEQLLCGLKTCSGCLLRRAIDLGYSSEHARLPVESAKGPHVSSAAQGCKDNGENEEQSSRATVGTSTREIASMASFESPKGSSLFLEDDEDEGEENSSLNSEASLSDRASIPDMPDFVDLVGSTGESDATSDEFDPDLGRWYSRDFSQLKQGTRCVKTFEQEVVPRPRVEVVLFSNDIGCAKMPHLITQDLNSDDRPPVEEVVTPLLSVKFSRTTVRRSTVGTQTDTSEKAAQETPAGTTTERPSRLRMTFSLATKRMTIDRRPMLKRLKTNNTTQVGPAGGASAEVALSTPLIGPGEDCDQSDDDNLD